MTKVLENLFAKARQTGEANKNGRPSMYGGKGYLQEQWHVKDNGNAFELRHWGTIILSTMDKKVRFTYGQSNSDRDALNQAFYYLGIPYHAHYYPSRDTFEIHDQLDNVIKSID